ncbi:P-loop containing nucleoside triphosphate hydrolase protein [Chytriomyces cf. hyalinus JEL632]|nr:P-loop containing nucleoside triphosphate hydrolase protein [Chytriomyces cf. hyalinus JEL632]
MEAIIQKTALLHKDKPADYKLPGLLIIDTPGHESFTNLRSRGSSLCNIAVLVVDIMHGLEPQTIESIGLLKARKTPFIVALNKIDRIYGWKAIPNCPTLDTLAQQPDFVIAEFNERVAKTKVAFAEQGLNAELYYNNKNISKYVSLVPTSAITGEGIPDLLHLLVDLTQNRLTDSLMYLSELECTVLEVKVIEGLGTTIDVVLSNGILHEGDKIILCGLNGPIVTNIRALLTPEPMRELRIKSAYVHHKQVKAALGVKISAPGLEKAIAGSRLMVLQEDDDVEDYVAEIMSDFSALNDKFITPQRGVCVQASTLGSLEALLTFLQSSNIPVSGYNIGPVHKKDIIRTSIMLEKHREFAMLLAFDVVIDRDAEEMAEREGIKIFKADIIYHLFDKFTAHMKAIEEQKKKDAAPQAVFPCVMRIIPGMVFNKRSPIIMGCDVIEGVLKVGTPICVVDENKMITSLGRCTGIELNRKSIQEVKKGGPSVSVKLEVPGYDTPKMFGRHFTMENELYSHITRASIDILKTTFRNELTMEDWKTVKRIKGILNVPDM